MGTAANGAGQVLLEGTEPLSATVAIWNASLVCQIFRETRNLWVLTCLNLKHKTVQAKRNFAVGPHMAKCSSLGPLVCTVSKSIECEWKTDFRLENKSMSYLSGVGREGMVTLGAFERDFFF